MHSRPAGLPAFRATQPLLGFGEIREILVRHSSVHRDRAEAFRRSGWFAHGKIGRAGRSLRIAELCLDIRGAAIEDALAAIVALALAASVPRRDSLRTRPRNTAGIASIAVGRPSRKSTLGLVHPVAESRALRGDFSGVGLWPISRLSCCPPRWFANAPRCEPFGLQFGHDMNCGTPLRSARATGSAGSGQDIRWRLPSNHSGLGLARMAAGVEPYLHIALAQVRRSRRAAHQRGAKPDIIDPSHEAASATSHGVPLHREGREIGTPEHVQIAGRLSGIVSVPPSSSLSNVLAARAQ